MPKFVLRVTQIDNEDTPLIGREAANLGELSKQIDAVSDGFVISSLALDHFLNSSSLAEKINSLLSQTKNDSDLAKEASNLIRRSIEKTPFPDDLQRELLSAYQSLQAKNNKIIFSTSPLSESKNSTNLTLNKPSTGVFLGAVKDLWSSSFDPESISSGVFQTGLMIRKGIVSEVSGTVLTINPEDKSRKNIGIQASWGARLGQSSDFYEVEKTDLKIMRKEITSQETQVINTYKEVKVSKLYATKQKLSDEKIQDLAQIAKKIESFFGFPQKIDWSVQNGKLFITHIERLTENIDFSSPHLSHHRNTLKEGEKSKQEEKRILKTATKVFVQVKGRQIVTEIKDANVDGAFVWAEDLIAEQGTHPRRFVEKKSKKTFIQKLSESISSIASGLDPAPVFFQASDLTSSLYRSLKFGEKYEEGESVPYLGKRGAFKHLQEPELFQMELEALKTARNKLGHKNLSLVIPFVRSTKELFELKRMVASSGLYQNNTFKIYVCVETPSSLLSIEKLLDLGIDGVFFGFDVLESLMLGVEKNSLDLENSDETFLSCLEKGIKSVRKRGLAVGIWSASSKINTELTENLIAWGVSSLVVSPLKIEKTRELVYEAERKVVLKG